MKVIFISPFLYRCARGIERYTVDLSNALADKDVEVHLLTWGGQNAWSWGDLNPGVYVHTAGASKYFEAFWTSFFYVKKIFEIKPDVINIFFSWHGEDLGLRFAESLCIPYNLILHYPAEHITHRYKQLQKTRVPSKAKEIIAVSQYVQEGIFEWFHRQAIVIPSGVDTDKFKPSANKADLRRRLGVSESSIILFTVAALEERKNIDKALNALPHIIKKIPELIYWIAGEGPQRRALETQVEQLGLQKNVLFLGVVTNPTDYYQASDLFMFFSRGEAGPLAMLEAMACGLPIVAAKNRPLNEYLPPEMSRLVNEENPEEIAEAVLNFLGRKELDLQKAASENFAYAEKNFGWSSIADCFLKVFEGEIKRSQKVQAQ